MLVLIFRFCFITIIKLISLSPFPFIFSVRCLCADASNIIAEAMLKFVSNVFYLVSDVVNFLVRRIKWFPLTLPVSLHTRINKGKKNYFKNYFKYRHFIRVYYISARKQANEMKIVACEFNLLHIFSIHISL